MLITMGNCVSSVLTSQSIASNARGLRLESPTNGQGFVDAPNIMFWATESSLSITRHTMTGNVILVVISRGNIIGKEPKNVNEALGDESWIVAMQEELNQFIANDVWEFVPQPKKMTIIGTKWVFRNKLDENGIVSRNKARPDIMFRVCLCARFQRGSQIITLTLKQFKGSFDTLMDYALWIMVSLGEPALNCQYFADYDLAGVYVDRMALGDESIDSAFARFNTIITSLKALDEGYSSKKYLIENLKVPRDVIKKDYEIVKQKTKSTPCGRDFKQFFKRRGRFVRQPRNDKRPFKEVVMTRMAKVKGSALNAEIQIILLENVQSHRETRTKEHSLEVLGAIAVKQVLKRSKTRTCSCCSSTQIRYVPNILNFSDKTHHLLILLRH
ncbi:retrovirus-related pol polyprotein from transposon TNT 1-94 [Tanacetum coccineum]